MTDSEAKTSMTNTGLEKRRTNNEEELPIVLLHGTSGQSEDWSQVVELLRRHRPVIRLNYPEPVARTDLANAPRVSDFADRVVAAAAAGGMHRFELVGFSLGAAGCAFFFGGGPGGGCLLVFFLGFCLRGGFRTGFCYRLFFSPGREGSAVPPYNLFFSRVF